MFALSFVTPIARVAAVGLLAAGATLCGSTQPAAASAIACTVNCPPPPPPAPVVTTSEVFTPHTYSFGPTNADQFGAEVRKTTSTAAPTFYTYIFDVISPANLPPVTLVIPLMDQFAFTNYPGVLAASTPYANIFGSAFPYLVELSDAGPAFGNTPPYQFDQVYDLTSLEAPIDGLYATSDENGTVATFDPPVPALVPEPASFALVGLGLLAVGFTARRIR